MSALPLPRVDGGFRCVVADPPWPFNDTAGRGPAEDHYETMTRVDIRNLPVGEIAHPDSVLLLCTTATHLLDGTAPGVARWWGYEPKAIVDWIKITNAAVPFKMEQGRLVMPWPCLRIGTGHYTRAAKEHVILATRGSPLILARNIPDVFFAPRGRHSEKPDALFHVAAQLCAGPYVSLFERKARPGWRVWGLEAPAEVGT